ncbi:serine hydrolase domain-containing protein [Neobacillus vireti]|uniref:Penicillin-binding protein n=1 Tax=Neobacillus vireti LMG 21834 TaxID=1131730 RepID=A0AB94IV39_9BACI|nr:serine hydrolase domain-containing protein [Neobacillus vireti]ETI70888.1 penicillin-binding protein [Neobacillus vireti LMG 21834]KLT17581.1 penicillin-binding protein [Neobacillus vireti]
MKLKNINICERMEHYIVAGLSIALIDKGQINMTAGFGVLEAGTTNIVNSNSIFNACSISKFVTSMLVMKLTEQGVFDLDEDVNNRLSSWKVPENEFTQKNKVTLRRLLSHQSGVTDPDGSFAELNFTQGFPVMVDLLEGRTPYCNVPINVMYEPGSDFQYSDAGFCIIQLLIEDSFGKPFYEVMNEHIFEPLNLKNSSFPQTISKARREDFSCGHKNGKIVNVKYPIYPYPAASGLWTTPSDLAILVIEFMRSLRGESEIGLSASMAKEMINPQGCKAWTGLGVFLDGSKHEIEISSLGWGVGFQCMMVAYPYLETGAVIMTNTDLGVHQLKSIIGEVYNSLIFFNI